MKLRCARDTEAARGTAAARLSGPARDGEVTLRTESARRVVTSVSPW